jgi:hypothetical protein
MKRYIVVVVALTLLLLVSGCSVAASAEPTGRAIQHTDVIVTAEGELMPILPAITQGGTFSRHMAEATIKVRNDAAHSQSLHLTIITPWGKTQSKNVTAAPGETVTVTVEAPICETNYCGQTVASDWLPREFRKDWAVLSWTTSCTTRSLSPKLVPAKTPMGG